MAVFIRQSKSHDLDMFEGIIQNLAEEEYQTSVTRQLFAMVAMICKPAFSQQLSNGKLKFGRSGVTKITSPWVLSKYPSAIYEISTLVINVETGEVDFFIVYY